MNGDDPAGKDLPLSTPFGNEPIDRSSIAPRSDSASVHDPIDEIPFDDPNDPGDPVERWDAEDERRQKDAFAPPQVPVECYCLHCQRTYMSDKMWFQRVVGDPKGFEGFWMCGTPNCDGKGFTFDIHPTDPDHPANADWYFDEDEDDYGDEDELDEELDEFDPDDVGGAAAEVTGEYDAGGNDAGEYDPDESKYRTLDDQMGDADNDIAEGDEWKLGLAPGEPVPPQMYWSEKARLEWEEEQKRYDEPDTRPREIQWTPREEGEFDDTSEDDIPF